jgi:hypothetical protein
MAEESAQCRFAVILAADVVGFGRFIEQEQGDSLSIRTQHRRHILYPLLAPHLGRIVKLVGDGALRSSARRQRVAMRRRSERKWPLRTTIDTAATIPLLRNGNNSAS